MSIGLRVVIKLEEKIVFYVAQQLSMSRLVAILNQGVLNIASSDMVNSSEV